MSNYQQQYIINWQLHIQYNHSVQDLCYVASIWSTSDCLDYVQLAVELQQ